MIGKVEIFKKCKLKITKLKFSLHNIHFNTLMLIVKTREQNNN